MNRDGSTDIYALAYDSNEFSALRRRGYLADLSGNAQIAEGIDRMYPYVQAALKQDGKIIGIPISVSGQTLGINRKIWTRLGKTEEDLPKTWDQFFDWLETLPDLLSEDVPLVGYWEDRTYVRATILALLLTEYQVWMDGKGEDYLFNTPVLNGLVTRLNNVDYDALRIKEPQEDEDMEGYDEEYHEPLMELYYDSTIMGYGSNLIPMKFAFAEDEDPILPVEVTVAFVNPYSEHPQEAVEFLALALKNLDQYLQYTVFADKTEPVPSPYFEQNKKSWTEYLDTLNKRLETAEGENRTEIEESIREIEEIMADEESYAWNISPVQIEQYQKNVPALRIMDYSFINDMSASEEERDESGADPYYDMLYGEDSMKLSADEVLNRIDKRIQMIRLEGN